MCEQCGQSYRIEGPDSHEAREELHKTARYFAVENGIDLPSAYSVCLHLMGLDQAQDAVRVSIDMRGPAAPAEDRPAIDSARAAAPHASVAKQPRRAPGRLYDGAFQEAIDAGALTPRQAFERGNRDAFAQRLIERHHLNDDDAYAVTDNRMSLLAAIRRKRGAKTVRDDGTAITVRIEGHGRPQGRMRWVIAAAVFVGLVVVAGVVGFEEYRTPPPVDDTAVHVVTDAKGRVVQVAGPDPDSVLAAYCDSRKTQAPLEPLGLMPAMLETARLRVGILRDPSSEPEALLAIPIRHAVDGMRWVAGDGRAPLLAMRAPQEASAMFSGKAAGEVIEQ